MPTGGADTGTTTLDREATLAVDDAQHHYRIYVLRNTLKPNDTIRLSFDVNVGPQGFRNNGIDPSIETGGSFFTNQNWFLLSATNGSGDSSILLSEQSMGSIRAR